MAEIFDFHVQDDRSILIPQNRYLEPIMQEDKDVATWRFRIPKVLNNIDMSGWAWWFVYVNAKGQEYSELLTLTDDIDEPASYSMADYDIDYGISKFPGSFSFALEAISTEQGGEIDGEWHTKTYKHKVDSTLQGNQAEYAETESDVISALIQQIQNKYNALVGGATPLPVNLKSLMTDHDKVYLYTGSETGESTGYWYYYNGTQFVPGGLYGARVQIDPTLSQSGQAADAKKTGDEITSLKEDLNPIQSIGWENGYIDKTGTVTTGATDRQYSNYLVCPSNVNITYIAETAHANIFGISFYDSEKQFISGVANNGTNGTPQTVTSPDKTVYCRLSTKTEYVNNSYYLPSVQILDNVVSELNGVKESISNLSDSYIKFNIRITTRAISAESIDGLMYAEVVDDDYDITLYYLNSEGTVINTGWKKAITTEGLKEPQYLELRKSDNSALSSDSISSLVIGKYLNGFVTNKDLSKYNNSNAYVDSENGSDLNDGQSITTPFATIQKAIDAGFKNILVREGTYSAVILNNLDGVHIMLNKRYNTFDASTASSNPKITIDCENSDHYGVYAAYCSNCVFEDIEVINAVSDGIRIYYCENMKLNSCIVHDCPSGHGYGLRNSFVNLFNCGAYNIGIIGGSEHRDGFNIAVTGVVNLIDCWANYCEDDGVSHHDACEGFINGGEWHHCGKGGVSSPTHGAKVNVSNVYSHDNNYGLYAENSTASLAKVFNVSNCALKNNSMKDIIVQNSTANIWNCVFDTQQTNTGGVINVIS